MGVPGLRFFPTERELVCDYLYKKMTGNLMPEQGFFVRDFDLYGKEEPWEVWDRFGGPKLNEIEDLFFFTALKKKSAKGSRIDRTVGSGGGAWLGKNSAESIEVNAEDGRCIVSSKKRFTYTNQSSDQNGCWIIHEYGLCLEHPHNKNNNIVLCRLRKNHNSRGSALQGNQEKGAQLKKRTAMERGSHDHSEAKSDKGIENPQLNNTETEKEQRIDDAQFQLSDSELVETSMYFEPSYLMIDKEAPRVQENLSMWGATWTDSTATAWALEDAALETYEHLILDDFSIGAPLNIHDLLSDLQSSNDLEPADDRSDFSRNSCLQCSEALAQDPVSSLDAALFPQLFGKSTQEQ